MFSYFQTVNGRRGNASGKPGAFTGNIQLLYRIFHGVRMSLEPDRTGDIGLNTDDPAGLHESGEYLFKVDQRGGNGLRHRFRQQFVQPCGAQAEAAP